MTDKKQSGIYEILNTTNGKRYVGSSANLRQRKNDHWKMLRRNYHRNQYLQNAWNKYGEDVFEFDVIEYWEPEFLVSFEQWWMNILAPEYNIAPVAGSNLGYTHTKKARANMSAAMMGHPGRNKGVPMSEETKANMSAAQKGRKHGPMSEEQKAKLSAAMKGKPWTAARRAAQEARRT